MTSKEKIIFESPAGLGAANQSRVKRPSGVPARGLQPQSGDNHHAASYLPAAAHGLQPNPVASGRATRQRQSPRRRRALQLLGVAVTVIVDVDVFGCAGERRQEGRARAGRGVPGLRGAAVPGRGRRRDAHRVLRDGRGQALRHGLRQVRARLLRRRSRHRRAAQARRAHQYTLHGEVPRRDGVRQQLQAREATDDAHRRRQDPPRASTGDRRRRRRDAHARRWEAQADDTSDFGLRARTSRLLLRGLQHSWELHDTIRHPSRWHLQVSV